MGSRPQSPALQGTKLPEQAVETGPSDQEDQEHPQEGAVKMADDGQPTASPRPSIDVPAPVHSPPVLSPALVSEQPTATPKPTMSTSSMPSVVALQTASPRPSLDSVALRPFIDVSTSTQPTELSTRDPDMLQTELSALQDAHEETVRGHRDELNGHLERIDALQSKLAYLAQQLASSAHSAATDPDKTPADKKLADKDAQIAALMEEGQRLSKTEMKHSTTVKTLRAKAVEHNKEIATLKQRLAKAEKSITEQSERAKRAEAAERVALDKLKIVGKIEKDIELIKAEREEAGLTINELRRQLNDAISRADAAEKKKGWEAELQQRVEEEKHKWRLEMPSTSLLNNGSHLQADSPSDTQRRQSPDRLGIHYRKSVPRSISSNVDASLALSQMDRMFEETARRPSYSRRTSAPKVWTPEVGIPQRQGSVASLANLNGARVLDTPSIHTVDYNEPFENVSSPHRTINDMISVSTAGAGPSVQLVERMSAAVRRLESEKATSKEELARLGAQRDEAREEVVSLMREVEEKKQVDQKVDLLEKELKAMEQRYETTLEMLGEKTEMVEELEGDVADLKKIYRELVQTIK
ncbi:TATA element modulatory factor 1 TATA binding-domain-containing protein [Ampelomyces quisqualis]|uniref:TATA element modulatory factor 1 TATA binding-domain-containing protein n=1 Tax=Ampelomyces quisqualis TaxID=50730 RepID=A0A6A5Q8I1_AMPQU|nr:TATA element modulatory factor 1 TATA binding-domain-containing protein [Ampelomyces quisqualis]